VIQLDTLVSVGGKFESAFWKNSATGEGNICVQITRDRVSWRGFANGLIPVNVLWNTKKYGLKLKLINQSVNCLASQFVTKRYSDSRPKSAGFEVLSAVWLTSVTLHR
jgi:hypothetical protein